MKILPLLTLTCLLFSFADASKREAIRYFPAGTFYSDFPTLDNVTIKWYSQQLAALQEPALSNISDRVHRHSYRLTWLRTWDKPVAIRVEQDETGVATVTLKVTNGTGGGDKPGKLEVSKTIPLTSAEMTELDHSFAIADFWNMPTTMQERGKDGARWVIEAVNDDRYHVVDRWSPENGAVRDIGLHLLRLSRYEVPKDKVY